VRNYTVAARPHLIGPRARKSTAQAGSAIKRTKREVHIDIQEVQGRPRTRMRTRRRIDRACQLESCVGSFRRAMRKAVDYRGASFGRGGPRIEFRGALHFLKYRCCTSRVLRFCTVLL